MIFSIQPVPSRHGVHWPHALVGEELADVVQHVDHAGLVVEDRDGRGAEAEAADRPGPLKSSGMSYSVMSLSLSFAFTS